MPNSVRSVIIAVSFAFILVALYSRLRAARAGDKLDRTKEGWLVMIGLRLVGFAAFGSTAFWIWKPARFAWAAFPVPDWVRWIGVTGFCFGVAWLMWMFISLGKNLTDTVVTRKDAHFVDHGPYRYVRNPMYSGILMLGVSLGFALGTLLIPLAAAAMFTFLAIRTRIEEAYLIGRFGEQYRSYMKRVGRFFPHLN